MFATIILFAQYPPTYYASEGILNLNADDPINVKLINTMSHKAPIVSAHVRLALSIFSKRLDDDTLRRKSQELAFHWDIDLVLFPDDPLPTHERYVIAEVLQRYANESMRKDDVNRCVVLGISDKLLTIRSSGIKIPISSDGDPSFNNRTYRRHEHYAQLK